eukprot:5010897-Pleurochrysis_carterae.AAC.1
MHKPVRTLRTPADASGARELVRHCKTSSNIARRAHMNRSVRMAPKPSSSHACDKAATPSV